MDEKKLALYDRLADIREDAHSQLPGREGAIVVRYIEDAMLRLAAGDRLSTLPQLPRS